MRLFSDVEMRKKIDRTYRKGTEVGKNSRILQSTDN